ncbi:hypothetical protein ACFQE0_27495 [Methylobacterium komagatae]|uniref:Uncharacterized protein n=1 Tax=Methylobacterium komagatae TaxID=374425 RepID=A0ABW2BTL2_9HYPH
MKEPTTAKARGHWPEPAPETGRSEPWVPVTVYMPESLYGWFRGFVAASLLQGMFRNVGIGITNALYCIAGRDHANGRSLYSLAHWTAGLRKTDLAGAMFALGDDAPNRQAANDLITAAALAAEPYADQLPDDPERNAAVRRILAAVGVEVIEDDADWTDTTDDEPPAHDAPRPSPYLTDDDIPF